MPTVTVQFKVAPYDVRIGSGLLRDAGTAVCSALNRRPTQCVVVTSPRVRKYWGATLARALRKVNLKFCEIVVADGECNKNLHTVETILRKMTAAGVDRQSAVLALGGGVIGDMAGFAASIYMRGIPIIQIPTTLLAKVDAAIGGKTGVDLPAGKNLAGTFHQPCLVLADTDTLRTLPEREFRAGLYEVIKCGIIRDAQLFAFLQRERAKILHRDTKALESIIVSAVRVKADVVATDEREAGQRRILNFGHTIGHALEAATSYKNLLHGEAVGLGMIAAVKIAEAMQLTYFGGLVTEHIQSYGALPKVRVSAERIAKFIAADKKTVGGVPHFILPTQIGSVTIRHDVPMELVHRAIAETISPKGKRKK